MLVPVFTKLRGKGVLSVCNPNKRLQDQKAEVRDAGLCFHSSATLGWDVFPAVESFQPLLWWFCLSRTQDGSSYCPCWI